jgi:hypothetical protein
MVTADISSTKSRQEEKRKNKIILKSSCILPVFVQVPRNLQPKLKSKQNKSFIALIPKSGVAFLELNPNLYPSAVRDNVILLLQESRNTHITLLTAEFPSSRFTLRHTKRVCRVLHSLPRLPLQRQSRLNAIVMPGRLSVDYDSQIPSIRSRIAAHVNSLPEDDRDRLYYPEDIEELNTSDYEVRRFLIEHRGREEGTVKQILSACSWRKALGLRDIRDDYFPIDMWFIGGVFIYEPDREGRQTFYIRLKTAITTREVMMTVKKFLAYLSYKIDRAAGEEGYIVLIDFQGITFANCDLEMAKYVLELKDVFPNGLKALIAIDCPFIARAGWNMVKYAIPAEKRYLMQMVSRTDVTRFVAPENLPPFLGGTCQRKFCGPTVVPAGSPTYAYFGIHQLGMSEEKSNKLYKRYEHMWKEAEILASYGSGDITEVMIDHVMMDDNNKNKNNVEDQSAVIAAI